MTQATITVSGIMPPDQGKKQGKVIDATGQKWNVWADKLGQYQIGATYNIDYETNEFKGMQFHVIKSFKPAVAHAEPASQYGMPRTIEIKPQTNPPLAYTPSNASKDEQIFISVMLNNELPKFPAPVTVTEAVTLINGYRQIWRLTLGKAQGQVSSNDFNDEIPL